MLNEIEERKLNAVFDKKFRELAFSDKIKIKTWSNYLKTIDCKKWDPWDKGFLSEGIELIHDPSPFGGFLILTEETAKKILAIGLP